MAIFKCKMCGGDLNITEGATVCECEYCGTSQTVPTADNEKKLNLFNRANRLRFNNEFDSAAGVFQSIVSEFPEEAEAYWGLCLCKYGIEYVDDPATAKKIPTCHRTSYESIFDDGNFELALEYSDSIAKRLYREEAKEIDRLQKAILDIVKNEAPYDIFICYKETAEDGQRTKDSVLAQEMYDALTEKGYKVFFSRITLEDKLGQEYEPYIFSALNSARIMLAVGTDYDYFNAVWVKNEWSRFLDLMKSDKSKVLIPCYADIDAYDMPKEFKNLQGQDMGKIGFIQDLVRGVGKILKPKEDTSFVVQQVVSNGNPTVESLLKRAFMYLEDGEWDNAKEYCDKILDIDPENAEAYLGKLMAEMKCCDRDSLKDCAQPFDENNYYKKVIRFGNDSLKEQISEYNKSAHKKYEFVALEREKEKNKKENVEKEAKYNEAKTIMENADKNIPLTNNTKTDTIAHGELRDKYKEASNIFNEFLDYKDSKEIKRECDKGYEYECAVCSFLSNLYNAEYGKKVPTANFQLDLDNFKKFGDYKDAQAYTKECLKMLDLCPYCGGEFHKVLFTTRCSSCGKIKDY